MCRWEIKSLCWPSNQNNVLHCSYSLAKLNFVTVTFYERFEKNLTYFKKIKSTCKEQLLTIIRCTPSQAMLFHLKTEKCCSGEAAWLFTQLCTASHNFNLLGKQDVHSTAVCPNGGHRELQCKYPRQNPTGMCWAALTTGTHRTQSSLQRAVPLLCGRTAEYSVMRSHKMSINIPKPEFCFLDLCLLSCL